MAFKDKVCKECGAVFTPRNGSQVYCAGPHFAVCENCGQTFSYTCSPKERPRYCCQSCVTEGKKKTVREKYGVDNVSELGWVRDKISERNSSDEVSSKRKATCMRKYGVDNVSKVPEVADRLAEFSRSEEYKLKSQQTSMERYGVPYPMQSEKVRSARDATCINRYGSLRPPMSLATLRKVMIDGSKAEEFLEFKNDPRTYITTKFDHLPNISELEVALGVTNTPIYDVLVSQNCSDLILHKKSNMEIDVINYITEIVPDIQIVCNDRTIIKPLELDIYLPQYNIAIECNPTATHNSSIKDPWGAEPKHYRYHQNKSQLCEKQGVFLFHIFGYEWNNRQDVIKSMLRNLLGVNDYKIGARDTYVSAISFEESKQFFDTNHRQGHAISTVNLGLRLKSTDELVSLMAFSKPRKSLGKTSTNIPSWELSRFCSKQGYTISGAASKLLKHFRRIHSEKIYSFSDIAHTRGTLYEHLGFTKVSVTPPSYVWVTLDDKVVLSRVSCQKQNLSKLFHEEIDMNQTEKQIMESHGYVRVYDSGVCRWELN